MAAQVLFGVIYLPRQPERNARAALLYSHFIEIYIYIKLDRIDFRTCFRNLDLF